VKLATAFFQITIALLSITMAATLQGTSVRSTPVGVGDVAPNFTLEDQNGAKVTLSNARGKSPVVLVFYRGYW
jgi:cytochrome oxidase Cu insertion factor (SCO1/SenC/PrrC family)